METFKEVQKLISPKLTWEVFESVLQCESKSRNIQLINITLGKPTKKGDSYLSTITRFSVEYAGDGKIFNLHVISKSLLKNIAQRKTFRNHDFFLNEVAFYSHVWPVLDAFQKELKPAKIFDEIPNFLCGEVDGANDYVLLEDLSFQGYEAMDRSEALTFERAKLVLKVLSQFHALGFAFKEKHPKVFDEIIHKLKETYIHEDYRSWCAKQHTKLKNVTLDAVQQELSEIYSNKLKKAFSRDIYGEATVQCSPDTRTKFQAITHGDTWIPNFLIRFNESKQPMHSKMLDFQLARATSIGQDIHFFIYACTEAEFRAECYEDMLKYYCDEFNSFVGQLCPELLQNGVVLTYNDVMDELKANGSYGITMAMEGAIMSMLDDDEVSDLDQIEGEDAVPLDSVWIVKPLKTKEKRLKLANIVKHMIDYEFL